MIKVILFYFFFTSFSYGIECNKISFDIGNSQISEVYEYFNQTVISKRFHKLLKSSRIREKNFRNDLKILDRRISFLNKSEKYLNKSNNLNKINIIHWKKLKTICTYENLDSSNNFLTRAINIEETINQQLERVLKYKKRIIFVKNVGNDKWGGNK